MTARDTKILMENLLKLPSGDHSAFIRAIIASDHDEAPRKVYADWLDENGLDGEAEYQRGWTSNYTASREWLERFAKEYRTDYDRMVGDYATGDDHCFGTEVYLDGQEKEEFFAHLGNVLNREYDAAHVENSYFRCAC